MLKLWKPVQTAFVINPTIRLYTTITAMPIKGQGFTLRPTENIKFVVVPGISEAYSNLDITLRETGHLEAAVQVHKKAMELRPPDVGTLTNYGPALQAAAETGSTIAIFERALSFRPRQRGRQDQPGDRADGSIGSQSRDRIFPKDCRRCRTW